ncbi:MAG: aspartyl/asparaginyl beta-hydroxylase domain-containing protein [Sphingomonadales bacterium]
MTTQDVKSLFSEVEACHGRGDFGRAAEHCRRILEIKPEAFGAAEYLSSWAMHNGEFAEAAAYLEAVIASGSFSQMTEMNLGRAHEAQGQWEKAAQVYRDTLHRKIQNPAALLRLSHVYAQLGNLDKAAKAYSLGGEMGDPYTKSFDKPGTTDETRRLIFEADERLKRVLTDLHNQAVDATQAEYPGEEISRIREAIWVDAQTEPFEYRDPQQKPWNFYVPGLEPRAYFEREDFPWIADVEASFEAIKTEMEASLSIDDDTIPYIRDNIGTTSEAAPLTDSRLWTVLHLYFQGKTNDEALRKFPSIVKMLEKVPLAMVGTVPQEVFFSILQPGGHIVPHFGVSNHWLTVHLPLLAPGNGGMRSGPVTRPWEEGKCLIFDDSFDHEAWNNADSKRIVLIMGIWHPDLSEAERGALSNTFLTHQAWVDSREQDVLAD